MNITGELPSQEVIELDQSFFPHPWTLKQWQEFDPKNDLLYVVRNPHLMGFALFGKSDDTAHLYKILLHPNERGNGQALLFWEHLTQDLKMAGFMKIYLEVEASNSRAISFYKKAGLKELRKIKGYYSTGEDALTMLMPL